MDYDPFDDECGKEVIEIVEGALSDATSQLALRFGTHENLRRAVAGHGIRATVATYLRQSGIQLSEQESGAMIEYIFFMLTGALTYWQLRDEVAQADS